MSANHYAASISLVTRFPKAAEHYKDLLADFDKLSHITIEVNTWLDKACSVKAAEDNR